MTAIRATTVINAPVERVWDAIEDIESQVRWMEDAVAIRFTSAQRSGVGASFDCDTRVGPLRLVDRMRVTEWDPPHRMGIRHAGLVTGSGRFSLEDAGGPTRFTWEEDLAFPWWMGGRAGGAAAAPVLRRVWQRNLRNLKTLVERSQAV
jgi:uncharacterized protein YndB with AHSA1/START domain